jgi:hypothetical protein
MATRDLFLDALAPAPTARAPRPYPAPPPAAPTPPPKRAIVGPEVIHQPPRNPPAPPTPARGYPDTLEEQQKRRPRPDYADDIDRIVAELVRNGDVVFDAEADCYRGPRWRCYRFGDVS